MEAISPISFMANNLQNRQLCTEFAVQVAKFRSSEAASNQKLEQLASSDEEIGKYWIKHVGHWPVCFSKPGSGIKERLERMGG